MAAKPVKKSTAKASTTTMGSRTGGKITVDTKANAKRKAEFEARTEKALTAASMLIPGAAGVRVGAAVGKSVARAITKSTANAVRSNALKSAGKAKNAKAIARPKPPTGKTYNAAPGKTVSVKGTTGIARVKPQGAKPTARVVGRGTDLAKTDKGVRGGNTLRRSNAMKVASQAERAYIRAASKRNQSTGKAIGGAVGGTSGTAAGVAASKKKKK